MGDKTVERVIKCCDFCISEDVAMWVCVCAKCGRDACANCGLDWSVLAESPQLSIEHWSSGTIPRSSPAPVLSAFFCNDCRPEVETAFLRIYTSTKKET